MEEAESGQRLKGPLSDLRVIEMGQLLAGPFTGSRMADFGAEVIKVEAPGRGDAMREWGHHRYKNRGLWWPILARNKKSVTANLRDPRGQDLVRRLIKTADVYPRRSYAGERWIRRHSWTPRRRWSRRPFSLAGVHQCTQRIS